MRLTRRRKPGREGGQEVGRFERLMFSFMGPPELGEDKPREGYVPDATAALCHKCGQPWEAHERVHTGSMTYLGCPPAQAAQR